MQVGMISDVKAEVEKRERTKWENVEPMKTNTRYRWLFVVQLQSRVQLFATTWTAARQASLSFAISWSLLKLMSIELVMPSNISSVVPFSSHLQSFPASGSGK